MNVFDNITATPHVVCESSLLKATTAGHIYSLCAHADLDNGSIVCVGTYKGNQVYNSKAFAAGSTPILVLTVPTGYSALRGQQDEKYFYNKQGEIMRGYELCEGDIYTVSANAFPTGTPAVGKFVSAAYAITDSAPSTGLAGEIIDKVTHLNGDISYRIAVRSTGV